jgi:hypothetical protein
MGALRNHMIGHNQTISAALADRGASCEIVRLEAAVRQHVSCWHLTSFTRLQKFRRNRINSGQTAPSGFTGVAAFDPTATSTFSTSAIGCVPFLTRRPVAN